jgi:hypothetical protein
MIFVKTHVSKQVLRDLPKAITLSPEDLEAHIPTMKPLSELANLHSKNLAGAMSEWTEFELAYTGESKGSVSVYDSPGEDGTKYIVIMLKRCANGPPLLPMERNGSLEWVAFEGDFSCATYLKKLLERLKGDDWSSLILDDLNDQPLVWYQATVAEDNWRFVWDALLKPFSEQRRAYRGLYKTKKAPEIFFGVEARFQADVEAQLQTDAPASAESSRPRLPSVISTSNDTAPAVEAQISDTAGIEIPEAEDWFDFWRMRHIPQERTFIHFANALSDESFPRRSTSCPVITERISL